MTLQVQILLLKEIFTKNLNTGKKNHIKFDDSISKNN